MASEIRLLVKNAGQAKDFPILLANTATVGDLKGELQRSYPSHPNPAQQKLIFAGRLLNDDAQSLAQLITTSKYDISATQTVHLVLPPTLSSSTSGIPSPTVNRIQTQPELRRSAPAGFGSPVAVPHQLPAIHGQPHPRYVPGNGIQPPFPRPAAAAAAIPDGPALPQPAAAPAPAQPQQPAAPGFLGRQNWMLMLKLVVIIYIFSQGGGSTRLALLSFGAFVIYLYHMGLIPAIRFTIRRAAAPPVAAPAEQRADDQPQQREEAQEEEAAPAVAAAATTEAQPPAVAAAQRVGLWRELENLFLPFVYSLIPTWQPDQAVQAVPAAVHPHQE